jgi:hypothetical protein
MQFARPQTKTTTCFICDGNRKKNTTTNMLFFRVSRVFRGEFCVKQMTFRLENQILLTFSCSLINFFKVCCFDSFWLSRFEERDLVLTDYFSTNKRMAIKISDLPWFCCCCCFFAEKYFVEFFSYELLTVSFEFLHLRIL